MLLALLVPCVSVWLCDGHFVTLVTSTHVTVGTVGTVGTDVSCVCTIRVNHIRCMRLWIVATHSPICDGDSVTLGALTHVTQSYRLYVPFMSIIDGTRDYESYMPFIDTWITVIDTCTIYILESWYTRLWIIYYMVHVSMNRCSLQIHEPSVRITNGIYNHASMPFKPDVCITCRIQFTYTLSDCQMRRMYICIYIYI